MNDGIGVEYRNAFGGKEFGGFAFAHADRAGQADDKGLIAGHAVPYQRSRRPASTSGFTPKKASKDGTA